MIAKGRARGTRADVIAALLGVPRSLVVKIIDLNRAKGRRTKARIGPKRFRTADPPRGVVIPTKKELDDLCREIVFARDGGKCRRCGRRATEWAHAITRSNHSLRFDPENSWASCGECHRWWHENRKLGKAWFDESFGIGAYDAIKLKGKRRKLPTHEVWRSLRAWANI